IVTRGSVVSGLTLRSITETWPFSLPLRVSSGMYARLRLQSTANNPEPGDVLEGGRGVTLTNPPWWWSEPQPATASSDASTAIPRILSIPMTFTYPTPPPECFPERYGAVFRADASVDDCYQRPVSDDITAERIC